MSLRATDCVERIDQQRRLAAAGHAGDAGEEAERNVGVDVLKVIAARVDDLERAARIARPPLGIGTDELAGEVFAGP